MTTNICQTIDYLRTFLANYVTKKKSSCEKPSKSKYWDINDIILGLKKHMQIQMQIKNLSRDILILFL